MPSQLCPVAEVGKEGKEVIVEIMGKRWYLALFQSEDQVVCYHNVCPHQGRNLNFAPDKFFFDEENQLVCPHHGAVFNVGSGECLQGPCKGSSLKKLPVNIENGMVHLTEGLVLGG